MIKAAVSFFLLVVAGIAYKAGSNYSGSLAVYLAFSLIANALFINGFRRGALFFDTFIGIFLWLGFWLKFSVRMALNQLAFLDALAFDGSPAAFDHALIVASCGLAALLIASLVRELFFTYPIEAPPCNAMGLFRFYQRYRVPFVAAFLATVIAVAFSNVWLGIYQRGMLAQTTLPYGLNGVYKWLLQFGLASVSAVIIRFEIELNRKLTLMAIVPALLETFLSNISLLSRGMILNAAGLAAGGLRLHWSTNIHIGWFRVVAIATVFSVLFVASVLAVNYLRAGAYLDAAATAAASEAARAAVTDDSAVIDSAPATTSSTMTPAAGPSALAIRRMTMPLFLDRWVGIEGVVAVASSDSLGWDLWREAWQERNRPGALSIYDREFIDSPYTENIETPQFHFVSLPGIIAFLYFPGYLIFLFVALLVCGWFAAAIEVATYRYAGQNWILCSLIAQVIAYRYAHFGYVPAQSYLLFGALIANVAILFFIDYLLRLRPVSVPK